MSASPAPVDLLWTGGWDSTFRLLQLVVTEERSVRPHYIYNDERLGASEEVRAMRQILDTLAESKPEAASRVLPTVLSFRHEIAIPRDVVKARDRLAKDSFLGHQYVWISAYAFNEGLDGLEMSVHLDDKAELHLRPHVVNQSSVYVLSPDAPEDLRTLYGRFAFPLLDLSKPVMRAAAQSGGFIDEMNQTWFCHEPVNGQPCGCCAPCRYTIDEGLGERLPPAAHLRRRTLFLRSLPRRALGKARRVGGREMRKLGLKS